MIGLSISDIKDFTNKLFIADIFDNFLVTEASFVTFFSVSLDGRLVKKEEESHREYGQEKPGQEKSDRDYVLWKQIKPLAFQIIKGKQLPKSFRIVFKLSAENTAKTISSLGLSLSADEVSGLFLNIRYENKQIFCVTGCSMKAFTMDKTLEKEWDQVVRRFLRHHRIPYEEG